MSLEATMRQDGPIQRAWIVLQDESIEEVPFGMADLDAIYWPPTMPERKPGEATTFFTERDLFQRHVLQPEGIPVFVEYNRDPNALPERVNDEIRRRAKV
jgi:hypothetical protein